MTDVERIIIEGLLEALPGDPAGVALRELTDRDAILVATVIGSLVERGFLVVEEGEHFVTADGVRALYAK